jgi:DNA repair protein RadA/Sms
MAKDKQIFFCKECGFESTKWMGQCPGCKSWNSFVEEKVTVSKRGTGNTLVRDRVEPTSITKVSSVSEIRIKTQIGELDRVLGGGIVKGSLVLVGGDPGIGKSTLLLQMCKNLVRAEEKVLYVSGEESPAQIKMRGERLGIQDDNLLLLCDNDLDNIEHNIEKCGSSVVIIDSIQTMIISEVSAAPGTVSQVREVTARLMQIAKRLETAIFIVGHVTKEGTVAGPRTLEHMVDCVLYFEGDGNEGFRLLRGVKNRFGSTNEIGVFNMTQAGLEEVTNPSQMLLNGRPTGVPGTVVVTSMEGTRVLLVELQALVCDSNFNMPRRTTVGLDYNRVNLLMAVLEKRAGLNLAGCDAYVNIAGGMRINDPSADLGIVCAIASSLRNRPIEDKTVIIGEIGLAGEIRGVTSIMQRVKEAAKMGFDTCVIPGSNYNSEMKELGIRVIGVSSVREALSVV